MKRKFHQTSKKNFFFFFQTYFLKIVVFRVHTIYIFQTLLQYLFKFKTRTLWSTTTPSTQDQNNLSKKCVFSFLKQNRWSRKKPSPPKARSVLKEIISLKYPKLQNFPPRIKWLHNQKVAVPQTFWFSSNSLNGRWSYRGFRSKRIFFLCRNFSF